MNAFYPVPDMNGKKRGGYYPNPSNQFGFGSDYLGYGNEGPAGGAKVPAKNAPRNPKTSGGASAVPVNPTHNSLLAVRKGE